MKVLWEELEAYLPVPVCSCPHRCVCATGLSNARHQHEITRSIRFLTGLNDSFDLVRSQILLMNLLPNMNKIFSMVMQHERQFKYSSSFHDDSKILLNSVDSRKFQGKGRGNGRVCSICGRSNHTIDTCYRKHGFPPNFGKTQAMVNNSSLEIHEEREDLDDSKSCKGTESYGFTKEQYEHLVNLLATPSGSTSKVASHVTSHVTSGISRISYSLHHSKIGSWIVDSGASDHICSSLKFYDSYNSISLVNIKLPNGHLAVARFSGIVKFSPGLVGKNVLLCLNSA